MAKRNPENDLVVSSNAAAVPARHKPASKRAKHSAGAPTGAVEPAMAPEPAPLAEAPVYVSEPSNAEIATLAYSFWEARGCQGGSPAEDWLRAEQELRVRVTA
ncbi:MAG TPA: DUF2934 domain-containing protein [Bryobacteraceae bacterium]|nr:DUF2934 domain-containing protein [Bryobacteraceae bacterium]